MPSDDCLRPGLSENPWLVNIQGEWNNLSQLWVLGTYPWPTSSMAASPLWSDVIHQEEEAIDRLQTPKLKWNWGSTAGCSGYIHTHTCAQTHKHLLATPPLHPRGDWDGNQKSWIHWLLSENKGGSKSKVFLEGQFKQLSNGHGAGGSLLLGHQITNLKRKLLIENIKQQSVGY